MPNAKDLWNQFNKPALLRATKKFTDRTDHREAYKQLLKDAIDNNFVGYYAIQFHGVGGVGKSSLLRQLEKEAKESYKKAIILRADLDHAALYTPEAVLSQFKSQLQAQANASFPLFSLAMHMLSEKEGLQLSPEQEKETLMDDPVLSGVFDIISDLTGVGVVISAVRLATQLGKKIKDGLKSKKNAIQNADCFSGLCS